MTSCGETSQVLPDTVWQTSLQQSVLPAYEAFAAESKTLREAIGSFVEKPDSASLTQAQDQWKETALAWKRAEWLRWGPVKDKDLHFAFDFQPSRPHLQEVAISADRPMDSSLVAIQGVAAKGLGGLEVLLFGEKAPRREILAAFSADEMPNRRGRFALEVAAELQRKAGDLVQAAGPAFSSPELQGHAGVSQLANDLLLQLELLKNDKIGRPLGKKKGGQPQAALAEYGQAELSFPAMAAQVESILLAYGGDSTASLATLLKQGGFTQTDETIRARFLMVDMKLATFTTPLTEAVVTNQQEVETLYDSVADLIQVIKSDLFSQLNIQISFTDADGD